MPSIISVLPGVLLIISYFICLPASSCQPRWKRGQRLLAIQLAESLTRLRTVRLGHLHLLGDSMHRRVWPWDVRVDQKPQPRLAIQFRRERLRGQARWNDKPPRSYATARRRLEPLLCNLVYSPQSLTSSSTVQWLVAIPAAIAGVIRKALCVLQKL